MVSDLYLFTNGIVLAFEGNQQRPELQGLLTPELKEKLAPEIGEGTRITFARWRKAFFVVTKEEFLATELKDGVLTLRFKTEGEVNSDAAQKFGSTWKTGDHVRITQGSFKGMVGTITDIESDWQDGHTMAKIKSGAGSIRLRTDQLERV